jgi:5-methylcytosine-specific restriction endonuclease McrA
MLARKSLSTMTRLRVFEKEGGLCHLCGFKIQTGQKWEVEHRIPLALGGADDESNWSPAHVDCHKEKTREDVASIAKAKRQKAKHIGIKARSSFPCSRDSKWKRKMNGEVVLR